VSINEALGVSGWTLAADDTEFLSIDLSLPLTAGEQYRVDVAFSGILNEDQYGFFYSAYNTPARKIEYIPTKCFSLVAFLHRKVF
jgi:hypothetical protein